MSGDREPTVVGRYEPRKKVKAGLETFVSVDKGRPWSRRMRLATKWVLSLRYHILTVCLRETATVIDSGVD